MNTLLHGTEAIVLVLFLLIGMIVMVALGRWISKILKKEEEVKGGLNSLMGALFALSGLLLAFTFGMSQNRLEKYRTAVTEEVNSISTALLRAELYPAAVRDSFRADFKSYVDAVVLFYTNRSRPDLLLKSKQDAHIAAGKLWARVTQQSKLPDMFTSSMQMVPALNVMFDNGETRDMVFKSKVPDLIVFMLFVCVLSVCFLGGFTSQAFNTRNWIIISVFVIVTSMVIYTILDLSRPTRGMIRNEVGEQAIVELRNLSH